MDTRRWFGIVVGAAVLLCPLLSVGMPSHHAGADSATGHHGVDEPLLSSAPGLHAVDQDCCHNEGAGVPASKTLASVGVVSLTGVISSPATPRRPSPSVAPAASFARVAIPLRC